MLNGAHTWRIKTLQNEIFTVAANFPVSVVEHLPEAISTGIYYGWASVNRGPVYKMVMSIGWNPFYKNTKKSMVKITFWILLFQHCHHCINNIIVFCFDNYSYLLDFFLP